MALVSDLEAVDVSRGVMEGVVLINVVHFAGDDVSILIGNLCSVNIRGWNRGIIIEDLNMLVRVKTCPTFHL